MNSIAFHHFLHKWNIFFLFFKDTHGTDGKKKPACFVLTLQAETSMSDAIGSMPNDKTPSNLAPLASWQDTPYWNDANKNDIAEVLETKLINSFEGLSNCKQEEILSQVDELKQTLLLNWAAAKPLIDWYLWTLIWLQLCRKS